jgi:hypothetical protein
MAPAGRAVPADEVGLFKAAEGPVGLGWGEAGSLGQLSEGGGNLRAAEAEEIPDALAAEGHAAEDLWPARAGYWSYNSPGPSHVAPFPLSPGLDPSQARFRSRLGLYRGLLGRRIGR